MKPDFSIKEEQDILEIIKSEITAYMNEIDEEGFDEGVVYHTGTEGIQFCEACRAGNPYVSFEGPVWGAFHDPERFSKKPNYRLESRIQDKLDKYNAYFEYHNGVSIIVYLGPYEVCEGCSRFFSSKHIIKSGKKGTCCFKECNNPALYLVEFRESESRIYKEAKGNLLTYRTH